MTSHMQMTSQLNLCFLCAHFVAKKSKAFWTFIFLDEIFASLQKTVMLASHCPEIHTRWTHEYENSYFASNLPRYKSKTKLQPKKLRFLQKVTRYTNEGLAMAPDTITKSHLSWYFPPKKLTGREHEGHPMDTQCQNVNTMCANLVAKSSRL